MPGLHVPYGSLINSRLDCSGEGALRLHAHKDKNKKVHKPRLILTAIVRKSPQAEKVYTFDGLPAVHVRAYQSHTIGRFD